MWISDVDLRIMLNISLWIGLFVGVLLGVVSILWFGVFKKMAKNRNDFVDSLSDKDYRKYKEMNRKVFED